MNIQERILLAAPESFWFLAVAGVVAAAVCFYSAFRNLGRSRLIADTSTSKVRSAAQGYVELEGMAEMMEGAPIQAPLSGRQCVWYRYKIEEYRSGAFHSRRQSRWHTVERGVSDAIFHLRDDTGTCIVDPDGAHITPSQRMRWSGRHRRPRGMPDEHRSVWSELFSTPPIGIRKSAFMAETRYMPSAPSYPWGATNPCVRAKR